MNNTPRTNEWEIYCDESYYHMWRVRRKNERGFNVGLHVQNREGARQLVELLNKQDEELTAVTEQRDEAREQRDKWANLWADLARASNRDRAAKQHDEYCPLSDPQHPHGIRFREDSP
jgi:hypothetical protein